MRKAAGYASNAAAAAAHRLRNNYTRRFQPFIHDTLASTWFARALRFYAINWLFWFWIGWKSAQSSFLLRFCDIKHSLNTRATRDIDLCDLWLILLQSAWNKCAFARTCDVTNMHSLLHTYECQTGFTVARFHASRGHFAQNPAPENAGIAITRT